MNHNRYILIISAPDTIGIVANITTHLTKYKCNVVEASQFADLDTKHFFMRCEFTTSIDCIKNSEFNHELKMIYKNYNITGKLIDRKNKKKLALFVSKESHCLIDILHKWSNKELSCDIKAIISNHPNLESISKYYNIPYYFIPIENNNKELHFSKISSKIEELDIDTLILARYMQILPNDLCEKHKGNIINIHHSFLPSFIGAKPYHQAYTRGVKLIGATSHYVTEELDTGPIIEQDVIRVSHKESVKDLIYLGQDVERLVLTKAVKLHLEERIVIQNNKTILFK